MSDRASEEKETGTEMLGNSEVNLKDKAGNAVRLVVEAEKAPVIEPPLPVDELSKTASDYPTDSTSSSKVSGAGLTPVAALSNQRGSAAASASPSADLSSSRLHNSGNQQQLIEINYRPYASTEKWLKHRFSAWSSVKAWFVMALVIIFFGFGGPGFVLDQIMNAVTNPGHAFTSGFGGSSGDAAANHFTLQMLFLFFGAVGLSLLVAYIIHPHKILLSPDGISLKWRKLAGSHEVWLPWDKITRIYLLRPPDKTSPQDFYICLNMPGAHEIKLRVGAISSIDERQRFLQGLERWASAISTDAEIFELLTPPSDYSYTELWLQALSAPPKRERLTPLPEGTSLQDGKYTVAGQLGVGGQGTAYLAEAQDHDVAVVLKEFILPVYVEVNVRRQALEKMQNEATMLRRLDDPRVVRLHDFFIEDHRGYLVLERIDGMSLRQLVSASGALDESKVRDLAEQMCKMLIYLHGLSPPVVHRDFTPDNLILGKDGILKIVDFNVAQQSESTATGTVVGKHAYISPEQFRGKPTPQSDIYAMGATLFYLLIGEDPEPITASHPITIESSISPELDAIIAKATALNASARYQDINELYNDLVVPPSTIHTSSLKS